MTRYGPEQVQHTLRIAECGGEFADIVGSIQQAPDSTRSRGHCNLASGRRTG